MKRPKIITLLICCFVLVCTVGGAIAVSGVRMAGEERKAMEQLADSVAFTINGERVMQKEFNTYRTLMKEANPNLTDGEIKNKYIRQQVIFQEAEREGFYASDEEINALNESRFSWLDKDEQAYQIIKDYVDGLGITMNEYIEQSKTISKQAIISTKLKDSIENNFISSQPSPASSDGTEMNELKEMAEQYYNNYIDDLVEEAIIIE